MMLQRETVLIGNLDKFKSSLAVGNFAVSYSCLYSVSGRFQKERIADNRAKY